MGDPDSRQVTPGDVPANASDLRTLAEIEFELKREQLRSVQEGRRRAEGERREKQRNLRFLRGCFVVVLGFLCLAVIASAITFLLALADGEQSLLVQSLWTLVGSGGGGAVAWRFFAGRLIERDLVA